MKNILIGLILFLCVLCTSVSAQCRTWPQQPTGGPYYLIPRVYIPNYQIPHYPYYNYYAPRYNSSLWNNHKYNLYTPYYPNYYFIIR